MAKETYKRDLVYQGKKDLYPKKRDLLIEYSCAGDLLIRQKRPIIRQKRPTVLMCWHT
jgi:hypothetical protein